MSIRAISEIIIAWPTMLKKRFVSICIVIETFVDKIKISIATYFPDPVTIDYYTKSQSVKENDNVTLKCRTIGIPSAEIIWYFQDTKLGEITFRFFKQIIKCSNLLVDGPNVEINNENITLKKVQRDQSGSYACVAIQKLGSLKNIQQKNLDLTVERKKFE